jgi:hypothetical protein
MRLKIYGSKGYLVSVDFRVAVGCKQKSRRIHDSNAQSPHGRRQLTRVSSANVLDEGLRIGRTGRRMNSNVRSVKQGEVWCVSRIIVVLNWLNLNMSLAGLSWPLYIGGQVSRIRSGSIQITISVYDIISYFDYIYA